MVNYKIYPFVILLIIALIAVVAAAPAPGHHKRSWI